MRGRSAAIIAAETPEAPQDALVIEILARMVDEATRGVSAGFLRLGPGREVSLDIRRPAALDDLRGRLGKGGE